MSNCSQDGPKRLGAVRSWPACALYSGVMGRASILNLRRGPLGVALAGDTRGWANDLVIGRLAYVDLDDPYGSGESHVWDGPR
jgi:hypothetical protein